MTSRAMIPVLVGFMMLTGVCNTLLTKYQDMQCVADCDTDRPKTFEQPVIQMFIGEAGCWIVVLMSWLVQRVLQRDVVPIQDIQYVPVPSQDVGNDDEIDGNEHHRDLSASQTLVDPTNIIAAPKLDPELLHKERQPLDGWKVVLLALPAICDLCATTLMNVGFLFVAASIYQMTRGALVLFVGMLSVIFLKRHLGAWKWASLFIVVLGVAVVGLAGVLDQKNGAPTLPGDSRPGDKTDLLAHAGLRLRRGVSTLEEHTAAETVLGFFLIAAAQIFAATQFVIEESIMERYSMDPIRVVGWEGVFGSLITIVGMGVLHAIIGQTDAGRGGYFDAREGLYEIFHFRVIGITSLLIMVSIGGFNFFGLSVTRLISATARSTIDTCRTLFIWLVSLGLGWESFKWLQVVGFVLLVYGTALFNEVVRPPTVDFLRRQKRVALQEER